MNDQTREAPADMASLTLSEYCYIIANLTPDERKTLLEIALDWDEMTAEGYEPADITLYVRRNYGGCFDVY